MASVRDTIFQMLTRYPSLFGNRADCFVQLFLTNGNGYDWVDGELIDVFEFVKFAPDFKDEEEEIRKEKEKDSFDWDEEHYNHTRLRVRRNNTRIQFAIDNIDLMMNESLMFYSESRRVHYSGWDFCPLMAVPEDVKDDWKEAVLECMSSLHPFIYQVLPYCDRDKDSLEELSADLHRLKEEKFPEVIEHEKKMAVFAKKIIDKMDKEES